MDMTQPDTDFAPNFHALLGGDQKNIEEYGRFQQHLALLEDPGRVGAFLAAIKRVPPGEFVVDVGAGTGLLGIMALKQGFGHAILIEPSRKMGEYARHLAQINGVADRITIYSGTLESLNFSELPQNIDLVVTETISSLLFGFGSWDRLADLVNLRRGTRAIPQRGTLFIAPAEEVLSTRGPSFGGMAMLRDAGIEVDLYQRTFRSGGNIGDKEMVRDMLEDGTLEALECASFDFRQMPAISVPETALEFDKDMVLSGLVAFWRLQLSDDPSPVEMSNLDSRVTSWFPYYIPFKQPKQVRARHVLHVQTEMIPVDAPYKYAFRFTGNGEALTHVLYW